MYINEAMKKLLLYILAAFNMLPLFAENTDENLIAKNTWIIRANAGSAFANRVGTGESAWYSHVDKSSCGFQYGIDVLRYYNTYFGYGITFRHYMHNLSSIGNNGTSLKEDIHILYVAPQFSNVEEDFLFKGIISNIDLGIGYARYINHGNVGGNQKYSAPASGLGVNLNLGLEYKFSKSVGFKISISGEYYYFKNMHKEEYTANPFDKRSKLSMFTVIPQIGLSYHL